MLAFRKHCIGYHTYQGEHTRVPADGNDADLAALLRCSVNICKMLANACVGIEAVYYIEHLCVLRCLLRQIRCAAAAQYQDIDLILPVSDVIRGNYRHTFGAYLHSCRIPAGKYRYQLQILILTDRALHATGQVPIAQNSDFDTHCFSFSSRS